MESHFYNESEEAMFIYSFNTYKSEINKSPRINTVHVMVKTKCYRFPKGHSGKMV